MMVLTPICSHSLNARSIVLAPEDRVRIKVLNSGQVVSFDGDTSMELKAGDCIDIQCSGLQTVMLKLKPVSYTHLDVYKRQSATCHRPAHII